MYACCCMEYDFDSDFIGFPEIRTSRKTYKCNECPGEIHPGERYENVKCLDNWMGAKKKWSTHRTCWFCMKVREDFFECGWAYGQVREDFRECQGWDYVDGPNDFDLGAEEDE